MDPRVTVAPGEMEVWLREAQKIERTECTIAGATTRVRSFEAQLSALEASTAAPELKLQAAAVRGELRPIGLALAGGGDPNDPAYENLSGRINWLTIQVGNNSGRPTAAQIDWIDRYSHAAGAAVASLDALASGSLGRLNTRLRAAGLAEIR